MGKLKLGLLISLTNSSSYNPSLYVINKGDWQHSCGDMRRTIKALGSFGKPVVWVTFQGKAGYIIAVVMPENSNDNTTAFIHVPAKANITGMKLNCFVERVKKVICSKAAQPDMTNLETLFSEEIDEKQVVSTAMEDIKSKKDGPIAYRMYGQGTTLINLLDKLSQTYYGNYCGVFFIDKSSGIEVIKGRGKDLSVESLLSTIIINVPENQDGFKSEKHGSFELTEGESFNTTYTKKGYKDIQKTYKAKADDEGLPSDLKITDDEKFIEVKLSDITVSDKEENNKKIWEAKITIEYLGKIINPIYGVWPIPETAFRHGGITIRAEATGYEKFEHLISQKDDILDRKYPIHLEPNWQPKSIPLKDIKIKGTKIKDIKISYSTIDPAISEKDVINALVKMGEIEIAEDVINELKKAREKRNIEDPKTTPDPKKNYKKKSSVRKRRLITVSCVLGLVLLTCVIFLLPIKWHDIFSPKGKGQVNTEQTVITTDTQKYTQEIDSLKKENKELRTEIDNLKKSGASNSELENLKTRD